jgi:AcrR family transcriptional regulator
MDEFDEDSSPLFRAYQRRRPHDREARIGEHVQRHKQRGAQPRGRGQGLSRAEIVRAAVAVADAEGPDAISMRRLARELRAGAMSLYWHVESKEELIDLMLESLEAEIGAPAATGDWRADLAEVARGYRAGLLRHPWAIEFMGTRPPAGPNDVRNLERMLSMLAGLGLAPRTNIDILYAVTTYVVGAVLREVQEIRGDRIRAEYEAAATADELAADEAYFRDWLSASGDRYPNVLRMVAADVDPDAADTREERFEFGLRCLLDGMAAQLQDEDS